MSGANGLPIWRRISVGHLRGRVGGRLSRYVHNQCVFRICFCFPGRILVAEVRIYQFATKEREESYDYHNHPNFKPIRHLFIPLFGLLANLACMAFYIIGPFMGFGTKLEPFTALGIAAVWLIYGGIYFMRSSKATGRTTLVEAKARQQAMG